MRSLWIKIEIEIHRFKYNTLYIPITESYEDSQESLVEVIIIDAVSHYKLSILRTLLVY